MSVCVKKERGESECVCTSLCALLLAIIEIKMIQSSSKQSGVAAANISQDPLSLRGLTLHQ